MIRFDSGQGFHLGYPGIYNAELQSTDRGNSNTKTGLNYIHRNRVRLVNVSVPEFPYMRTLLQ